MNNLFLDANILLDFYRYGDDDITEISKLVTLAKDEEIRLLCNKHLKDEVNRNREKVLSDTLGELRSKRLAIRAPNYCEQFDELKEVREHLKEANKAHNKLIERVERAIANREIGADKLISDLWSVSHELTLDTGVFEAALHRVELGNPPGKKNSVGDAIHWESLLREETLGLYHVDIVSRDSDFASILKPQEIKDFLTEEWTSAKGTFGKVRVFPSLSDYFKNLFPHIKLSDETKKNELISRLQESPNFASTHGIIYELSKYDFFTKGQTIKLFEILVSNNQVGWIATDDDMADFYTVKLKDKAWYVPSSIAVDAAVILEVEKEEFFDAIPF